MLPEIVEIVIIIPSGAGVSAVGVSRPPGKADSAQRLFSGSVDGTGDFQAGGVGRHIVHRSGVPGVIVAGDENKLIGLPFDICDRNFHGENSSLHRGGEKHFPVAFRTVADQALPTFLVDTDNGNVEKHQGRVHVRCAPDGADGVLMDLILIAFPDLNPACGPIFLQKFGVPLVKSVADDNLPTEGLEPFSHLPGI